MLYGLMVFVGRVLYIIVCYGGFNS